AFSTVFAVPFVILSFAPQLLHLLPRSGNWLVAIKAVMGLVELAAALKFLSNADLVFGWGIFTRQVVIAGWIGVVLVLLIYLSGITRLGIAPRLAMPRLPRGTAFA